MSDQSIFLGAVAYHPKVVTIWEGMRDYFRDAGVPLDFALFSNYERQVETLLRGHIDVAWNTPLAHVQVKLRTSGQSLSLGMRDTDCGFRSKIVVRKDAGVRQLTDLRNVTLAVGSRDSVQARILPLYFLRKEGLDLGRQRLLKFDTDLGKHGDTGTSEFEVLAALHDGRAQAGAIGDPVWATEQAAGRVDATKVEVLWTTPAFDHCMFDALPSLAAEKAAGFQRALFAMRWDQPDHRRLLELEGLREWVQPREEGYRDLFAAMECELP
jgi:phosphonate transport system substrate-binding protein